MKLYYLAGAQGLCLNCGKRLYVHDQRTNECPGGPEKEGAYKDLKFAIEFLDRCRAKPKEAREAGCFKDAHEWLEAAARALIKELS